MIKSFKGFNGDDLFKVCMFTSSDGFSFSHIDSLVRSVSQKMFIMMMPPGIFKEGLNKCLPILNYGNRKELKTLIEHGRIIPENVYNLPENLDNASSKVKFHTLMQESKYVPKTVYNKKDTYDLKFPIIAKSDRGSKGEGVTVFKTQEDLKGSDLEFGVYSEKRDLDKEFRCISINGNTVFIAERIPENDKARSLREGVDVFGRKGTRDIRSSYNWKKIEMGSNGIPERSAFERICKETNDILKLEFLGIDIGLDKDGNLFLIEANVCPGLNQDQIVLIYEEIFKDFYNRCVDEYTQNTLNSFKDELMRANQDTAKFSFSPKMGRKFYVYDEHIDPTTGEEKGRSILSVKYDMEKSFGKTLLQIKKDKNMSENKVFSYRDFLNENEDNGSKYYDEVLKLVKDFNDGKKENIVSVFPHQRDKVKSLNLPFDMNKQDGEVHDELIILEYKGPDEKSRFFDFHYDYWYSYKKAFKGDDDKYVLENVTIKKASVQTEDDEIDMEVNAELKKELQILIANSLEVDEYSKELNKEIK